MTGERTLTVWSDRLRQRAGVEVEVNRCSAAAQPPGEGEPLIVRPLQQVQE